MNVAWLRRGVWAVTVAATGTAAVLACGPFFTDLITVSRAMPADPAAYGRGELGVVKPTFARRYLVQAYRTLGGAAAAAPERGTRRMSTRHSSRRRSRSGARFRRASFPPPRRRR